jgi:hypothetical protein
MRYENGTHTAIELIRGDIRDAPESFVVIGRDPDLKSHYASLTGATFNEGSMWLGAFPVEFAQTNNQSLNVLRTWFRPSESSHRRFKEIARLQSAIEYPLVQNMRKCNGTQIAMVPISCRAPLVVATGMIRMIWDISVAAFLHISGPLKCTKPTLFTIYCNSDLQPFFDVLDSGYYASLRNGWLFNTEISCNRAKRARYLARRKFKYHRATDP